VSELILHHYDFSPFAEKIRLALGLKRAAWRSVIAPSVMPKPELTALTGGYRHIPVLQIGADVYCDTRTIARELDRRFPDAPLQTPATRGLAVAIEAWAERDLFWPIARYVSGINADTVSPQLHVDRAALRGKPTPSNARLKAVATRNLGLMRSQLPVVEDLLAHGRDWLVGDAPGQADLAAYHGLWFLSAFAIDCSHELVSFGRTRAWMARVAAIGHGVAQPMSAKQALDVAAQADPAPTRPSELDDALPRLGAQVAVRPDDYTTAAVEGELVQMDRNDIAIRRHDTRLGETVVHFPRNGYAVKAIAE
jgi:glutathione S-transferase